MFIHNIFKLEALEVQSWSHLEEITFLCEVDFGSLKVLKIQSWRIQDLEIKLKDELRMVDRRLKAYSRYSTSQEFREKDWKKIEEHRV